MSAPSSMSGPSHNQTPAINPNNVGPRIFIAGGVMLSAVALMLFVTFSNRFITRTLLKIDSVGMLISIGMSVGYFALWAAAVNAGFGRHLDSVSATNQSQIKTLLRVSIILFFISNGIIKLSYNFLARETARSVKFKWWTDIFSIFIVLWTLVNLIAAAVNVGVRNSPNRTFLWVSGILSIIIVIGQLVEFLWIIWGTMCTLRKKIEWSISMGAFVPFCIAAIVLRLVVTPADFFEGDWTFKNVWFGVALLIELNMVIITVLAPNLPNFFDTTSTGGVHYQPGITLPPRRPAHIPITLPNPDREQPKIIAGDRAREIDSALFRPASSYRTDVIMLRHSIDITRHSSEDDSSRTNNDQNFSLQEMLNSTTSSKNSNEK